MRRAERLFEIIQILRQASGVTTAAELAEKLEISKRSVYRDIAALQARRIPIDGAAGVGYILRKSYDLPPINFDADEIEAIVVGLMMLARTGDTDLQKAAARVARKIEYSEEAAQHIHVSPCGVNDGAGANLTHLRTAIRDAQSLRICYENLEGTTTARTVRPIALAYFTESNVLAAWCEKRNCFRHFRVDRIRSIQPLDQFFNQERADLLTAWHATNPFQGY